MSKSLYRIRPPAPFTHELAGMTGRVVGEGDGHFMLSLTCRSETVRVPRSWLISVNTDPVSASEARKQLDDFRVRTRNQ